MAIRQVLNNLNAKIKYTAALVGCSRMGAFIDNESSDPELSPYSHAAGYTKCKRTDLIACSDVRSDVMEIAGNTYNIPKKNQYTDYKKMILETNPDIVSVATQPEQRAEIVIFAANNGAKAIYAEKAMSASLEDCYDMYDACIKNNVAFNLGTNRRYDSGFNSMANFIKEERLGKLKTLVAYCTGSLFNMGSHNFDLLLKLNNESKVKSVTANLTEFIWDSELKELKSDPTGQGVIEFENGVKAYAFNISNKTKWDAICENGVISAIDNGSQFNVWTENKKYLLDFEKTSSTLNLIYDLVASIDNSKPHMGGIEVSVMSTEIIFGFIQSHLKHSPVKFPYESLSIKLNRDFKPRTPKYNK